MSLDTATDATAGGEGRHEAQDVTDKEGRDWHVIWERGVETTYVAARSDGVLPLDLEGCR